MIMRMLPWRPSGHGAGRALPPGGKALSGSNLMLDQRAPSGSARRLPFLPEPNLVSALAIPQDRRGPQRQWRRLSAIAMSLLLWAPAVLIVDALCDHAL